MVSRLESPRQFLDHSGLGPLLKRIEKHGQLLQWVREILPAALAEHCRDCLARDDGRLILFTDSPAFGSQLRFHAPSILDKLNAQGDMTFCNLQVRNLCHEAPPKSGKPMPPISPAIIAIVKSSAAVMPSDELSAALARLGTTLEDYAQRHRT
ncbi:MAG: DUF721 domain-containing protein [Methylococcaceae bacterium]|nr:DUF721 domain-containing protein [Methylococcaceae bacterium]